MKHLGRLRKEAQTYVGRLGAFIKARASRINSQLEGDLEIEGGLKRLLLYLIAGLALFYIAVIFIFLFFDNVKNWQIGVLGDFIGGTLNPILSFLAFSGVLITIALQRKELANSSAELKRSADALEAQINASEQQKFENSFFNMLAALDRIVAEIDLYNKKLQSTQTGKDCFTTFYTRLTKIYRRNQAEYPQGLESEKVANAFQKFWRDHQLELATYFRFLYNIIRYIDENKNGRPHHVRLLRAQLSDQELLLIFYNCLSPAGSKMKPYVEKHALFDNLPTLRLLNREHIKLYASEAFGDNEMHDQKNTGMVRISGPRVPVRNSNDNKNSTRSKKRPQTRKRALAKRP
ncbi:putative phage abortive infection protein [Nocardioides marinus]|nr:putative phage abortive infection protein [Nocardioides marinus]